ncbi:MAG: hypothetical protein Tp182DCM212571_7 [Prokaryotic dsDNA virus sp.]|jgi:hypothetical protein|nr:MAG: hypothetical protein Tp182DCM212571_7 [Prokaryotic dsDNA virus sp.]|tara:strand:+ start:318 stop:470 length:153 start_codon:yes stop_codon:yes gene_type:complete
MSLYTDALAELIRQEVEANAARVLFGHHQIMADISDLTPEEIIDIRSLIG